MDFKEYKKLFCDKANAENKSETYINVCLNYAKVLLDNNVPVIFDSYHFSKLVGYNQFYLKHAVQCTKYYYWDYKIKKKNGGIRIIQEPMPNLKNIQLWILKNILYSFKFHPYAKAYIPHKSIRDNIRFHTKKRIVLALDIHDFFGSIKYDKIVRIYKNFGYADWVANLLAKLTCLNNSLPQGAPTSPALSNIFMYSFDENIKNYCLSRHIMYTRYADDMTFSGDFDVHLLIHFVENELTLLSLKLNKSKIRVMYEQQQQIVTGCVVNQKTHLPKDQLKKIRQEIYYIKKYGLSSHIGFANIKQRNYVRYLYGKINYALVVQPGNKEMKLYKDFLKNNYRCFLIDCDLHNFSYTIEQSELDDFPF